MFPKMYERIPEGKAGEAEIQHFEVSEERSLISFMRRDPVRPGRYARLVVNGRLMMSDTLMERESNMEVVYRANGHVLIGGLGFGMILDPILEKEDVQSVTVIEKYAGVVSLISPHFQSEKLSIINADIFEWKPEKSKLFDVIYFDIWPKTSLDTLKEMATLHRRFARCLNRGNPKSWMHSWRKDFLKNKRRQSRRWY